MSHPVDRFSVVIPTYNCAQYLGRALTSAVEQDLAASRIIVIDDGSTDRTRQVVEDFAPRIQYLYQQRQGPYLACMRGVERTPRGQFVVFLDADDRLQPGYLLAMAQGLADQPEADLAFGQVMLVDRGGRARPVPVPQLSHEPLDNFRAFVRGDLELSAGGAVFSRRIFDPWLHRAQAVGHIHGMDRVAVGQALASHVAVVIPAARIEIHDRPGRLRDDVGLVCGSSLEAIDVLFDAAHLPAGAMEYRQTFRTRLLLEQARLLYRSSHYREALDRYRRTRDDQGWRTLGRRHLKRYLVCLAASKMSWASGCRNNPPPSSPEATVTPFTPPSSASSGSATPTPSPPLSPRGQRRAMRRDPMAFLCRCADEHGPVVRLMLDRTSFLLSDPQDIRHVLVTDPLNYYKEQTGVGWFRSIFGRSLPFLEGAEHRRVSRALQPSFRPRALDQLPASLHTHVDRVFGRGGEGEEIDLAGQMRQVMFGVAGESILGVNAPEVGEQLFGAINQVHRQTVAQMPGPVAWRRRRRMFSKARRRHRRAHGRLDALVLELIVRRRAEGIDGPDVLSALLRHQAQGSEDMGDMALRDHCVNLFLAATDPVIYATSWAIWFLADAPAIQVAAADEAQAVLAEGKTNLTRQRVQRLTQARRILMEALRLRPSTWMIERQPLAGDTLPSGVTLPAGSRIMISSYVLHHRPHLYPEPLDFDPGRFEGEPQRQRSPYAYLPFGAGPRGCIGQHMAMLTATMMLAMLVKRFEFQRVAGQPLAFSTLNGFTIQPPEGKLMIRPVPREPRL